MDVVGCRFAWPSFCCVVIGDDAFGFGFFREARHKPLCSMCRRCDNFTARVGDTVRRRCSPIGMWPATSRKNPNPNAIRRRYAQKEGKQSDTPQRPFRVHYPFQVTPCACPLLLHIPNCTLARRQYAIGALYYATAEP